MSTARLRELINSFLHVSNVRSFGYIQGISTYLKVRRDGNALDDRVVNLLR
jgi:hypothetical protein